MCIESTVGTVGRREGEDRCWSSNSVRGKCRRQEVLEGDLGGMSDEDGSGVGEGMKWEANDQIEAKLRVQSVYVPAKDIV